MERVGNRVRPPSGEVRIEISGNCAYWPQANCRRVEGVGMKAAEACGVMVETPSIEWWSPRTLAVRWTLPARPVQDCSA